MKVFIEDFELSLCWQKPSHLPSPYREVFKLYISRDFKNALASAKKTLKQEKNPQAQVFLIHLICGICENLYDLQEKSHWLKKFNFFMTDDTVFFAQTAFKYHQAVNCYFESYYHEAYLKFKELTNEQVPLRFRALGHFHLGLIYQTKNLERGALQEYTAALKIAQNLQHKALIDRIQEQLFDLQNCSVSTFLDVELVSLLKTKQVKKAKSIYLAKRKSEKSFGFNRNRQSLYALLPVFTWLRSRSAESLLKTLSFIEDPAVKIQILDLLNELGCNSDTFTKMHVDLKHELGVNLQVASSQATYFLGKNIDQMESEDLTKFATYLKNNTKISKEEICRQVWGYEYDPVLHDGRIYKMIHKFRNYFGKKDILLNRYGYYEINPRYRTG